jgi:hypothetical protein
MLHNIAQIILGFCYGLYLVFLAPASQRQQAREWLWQQTSTSTLPKQPMQPQLAETVEEPKLQLHIKPDLEDFWLAEPRSIATDNQESHVAIAPTPLLLLPPARLISEQSATVALANSKATKTKRAKALANTPGNVPAAFGHMSATQLRKLCSDRNIKWRNVRGSKHLSKAEMIIALAAA